MTKLKRVSKDIQVKFGIGFLILIAIFTLFFWFFIREQERTIAEHHLRYIRKADATIATLLGQARLNSYITAKEIAVLLRRIEGGEIEKEDLLKHLGLVEKREEAAGILLAQHVLLAVDMKGYVLARSEWIRGGRVPLLQEGHIRDEWTPCLAFEQAFAYALGGESDVRKIIYDRDFLKREGYDFWGAEGMGLTVMTPIMGEKNGEQKGVLIGITFVNANAPLVAGLKAVTDVSFTAILPSGDIVGSIFKADSAEKIEKVSRSPELLAVARERAVEKGDLIRRGILVTDVDFILEEFTIEKIRLTHADVFGGAAYYYRVAYWLELDHQGNFASLRGIAMETDVFVAQRNFLIYLIGGISIFLLIIFAFFYLLMQKRLVRPITSFTNQLKTQKEDVKIEIPKNYQEFKELEDAFNSSFDQIKEARDILEIKIEARTRELKGLSEGLEEQVRERTREIQEKMKELEKFNKLAVGRELKMIELKKEIEELKEEIKKSKT